MEIKKTWTDLKAIISGKNLKMQYDEPEDRDFYLIFATDESVVYFCNIEKGTSDATDFETNYQAGSNVHSGTEHDPLGRWIVRMDSKRTWYDTVFAGAGDDINGEVIGGGQTFVFDFSNTDNDVGSPPAGFKQKQIDFQFLDGVYMKEGACYFFNAPKGAYIDMYVVCPDQYYFYKNVYNETTGDVTLQATQASGDTVISHWVIHYMVEGSCPMGDELNTESSAESMAPQYLIWRVIVTVPDETGYDEFHGHWNLEMYRPRSVVFA